MDHVLDKVMGEIESWRLHNGECINSDHQITAFHLACLLEEKFRVYALSGGLSRGTDLWAHILVREDIFALEWGLRSLSLPSNEYLVMRNLRNSWSDEIASKCQRFLTDLSNYYHLRDLVICAKRGGYIVETPKPDVIIFKDPAHWVGERDFRSRLITDSISRDRAPKKAELIEQGFQLDKTHLYEDFPKGLNTSAFSSLDFWEVWNYLFCLSRDSIFDSCKLHRIGETCMTSHTKELTILITKKTLIKHIHGNTGISKENVRAILNWIMFNSQTEKKFSLFHCPIIEVNKNFVLIAPHTIISSHVPTTFLRLLAHHDKIFLDQASSTLEKETLNQLKNHLGNENTIVCVGLKVNKNAEIDIVEYNERDNTLCIGQAKLVIRSDSVSEVDNANKMLGKGLEQLNKNKELLENKSDSIDILLKKIGVRKKTNIQLKYFLLPTSFTGSDFLKIPNWVKVMPVEFCLRPQCKGKSLCSIWADYKKLWDSLSNKIESSQLEHEFELAGFKIVFPGFHV